MRLRSVYKRGVQWLVSCIIALSSLTTNLRAEDSRLSVAIEEARALLQNEVVPKVPGLAVAVAIDGTVAWHEEFGYADLADRIPVGRSTRFRVGSVSKPITAVGLMLLVERGRLDLDAPIQTYIPDFPEKSAPLTLRLLAGHLSGIRDYHAGEPLSPRVFPDARSRLKVFEDDLLVAAPGEKFSYASFNWSVIEVAMEHAAGRDFVPFMDEAVLTPLQLSDTCAEQAGNSDPRNARFYEADEKGAFVLGPLINVQHAWAAGGYLSTAEDLVRFGSALGRPGFLQASSLQTLFTSQMTSDGKPSGYGVGWYVYAKPKVIYHSGWTVGGLSILLMLPDSGTVVALLTNRGRLSVPEGHSLSFNIEEIGFKLAQIFAKARNGSPPSAK